jgi:hypothetical protein
MQLGTGGKIFNRKIGQGAGSADLSTGDFLSPLTGIIAQQKITVMLLVRIATRVAHQHRALKLS